MTEFKAESAGMLNLHDRYPDFIAPCVGVHPIQSLCPNRSTTLEVCETALKSESLSPHYVLIPDSCSNEHFFILVITVS